MIDITAARESYNCFEISDIGLIRGEDYITDALTKTKANPKLEELIRTGIYQVNVVQWIVRGKPHSF